MARNATPITLSEVQAIYAGLGFTESQLQDEVEQANYFGMLPTYKQTPEDFAKSYASQYRREYALDELDACRSNELIYGHDC